MADIEDLEKRVSRLEDQLSQIMRRLGRIEAELRQKANAGHGHMESVRSRPIE